MARYLPSHSAAPTIRRRRPSIRPTQRVVSDTANLSRAVVGACTIKRDGARAEHTPSETVPTRGLHHGDTGEIHRHGKSNAAPRMIAPYGELVFKGPRI